MNSIATTIFFKNKKLMSSVQQQILSTKFIIRTKPFKIWRNFLELNLAMYSSHLKHEIMFMSGSIRSLDCW